MIPLNPKILAQALDAAPLERVAREFGRENWWLWLVVCLGVVSLSGWWYRSDTRELARVWRFVLFGLRSCVWGGLFLILLDPQERSESEIVRPSRVVLLTDTSASMGFPTTTATTGEGTGNAEDVSRIQALRTIFDQQGLLKELRKRHEIELYSFDRKLTARGKIPRAGTEEKSATDATNELQQWMVASGEETRLGEALLQAIRESSGETLSGIVLFTDGASNAGIDVSSARSAAISTGTRIVTVGFGSSEKPANLQVQSVQAPTLAHVGDGFQMMAFVAGQGMAGQEVTVELLGKDERSNAPPAVLQTKAVTILEDGVPVAVPFKYDSNEPGRRIFNIRATPKEGVKEFTMADNEKGLPPIEITDRKTKVLLLAGGPMRDFQFVRNLLYRDRGVETELFLQSGDPEISQEASKVLTKFPETREELFQFDVIVAFDPDWRKILPGSLEILSEWLSQHAGGLILVAGDVNTPNLVVARADLQQVQAWYPVNLPRFYDPELLAASSQQPWPVKLTREGNSAEFLNLSDGSSGEDPVWNIFSGVYRCFPDDGPKPGGTILAEHGDPRSAKGGSPPVLISSQFFGAGRVLYLGSPEFWRLRAIDETYYDRFWIKAIREVGQGRLMRGNTRGLILLEQSSYPLGSPVVVRARALDQQYQPFVQERLSAELLNPRGQIQPAGLELNPVQDRPGEYQGTFLAILPGRYRIKFTPPQSTEDVSEYVQVDVPDYEYLHPEQNQMELKQLAATETGGAYLTSQEVGTKLPELLPDRTSTQVQLNIPRPLWDRGWVMGVLIGLLGTEWLIRKLLKLA